MSVETKKIQTFIGVSLWFLLIIFMLMPEVFLRGHVLFFGDNYQLIVPQKIYGINELRMGRLPFWNPHILSGTPFWADISQAVLYPTTLLFYLFESGKALTMAIIGQLVIAAWGMYFFSRYYVKYRLSAVLAATIWILSQPIIMATNNLALLQTVAWLPWILGLLVRTGSKDSGRVWVLLPLVLALAILGGHPQPLIYLIPVFIIWIATNFRTLDKQFWQKLITVILIAFGLTIAQTVPFIELYSKSTRSEMPSSEALNDSIHPAHLIDLVIPNFFSRWDIGMTWGIYWNAYRKAGIFISWFGVLLIGWLLFNRRLNRNERWLFYTAVFLLIASLGKYLPWVNNVFGHLQVLNQIRNFSLILLVWPLLTAPLIAIGAERINLNDKIWKFGVLVLSGLILVFFSFLLIERQSWATVYQVAANYLAQLGQGFHNSERDRVIVNSILMTLLVSALMTLGAWFSLKWTGIKRVSLILIFLSLNMWWVAKTLIFTAPKQIYAVRQSAQTKWLKDHNAENYRTLSSNGYIPWTGLADYWAQMMVRAPFSDSSFTEKEGSEFTNLIQKKQNLAPDWNVSTELASPYGFSTFVLSDSANYWQSEANNQDINEVDKADLDDQRFIEQSVKYLTWDRTYIYPGKMPIVSDNYKPVYHEKDFVIFENSKALPIVSVYSGDGEIENFRQDSQEITFDYKANSNSKIRISVADYPGWKCLINNQTCSLEKGSGFYSVSVPKGIGAVVIRFTPSGWGWLLLLTAVFLIGYLLSLWFWRTQTNWKIFSFVSGQIRN